MTTAEVAPVRAERRARLHDGVVALLFLLLTLAHTWPLARAPFDRMTPSDDVLMNAWALRELTSQLVSRPLDLFDGNAFHPYTENTIALVDHMFANAILVAPVWLVTRDSMFIYNVALFATFALTGYFTYRLVARLCDSQAAGLVAGVAFAFSAMRWHQITHLHVASTQWVPLGLLALHAMLERPTWRRAAALCGAGVLVAWSSWHQALLGGFSLGIVAVWLLVGDGRPILRRASLLAAAALVVLACLVPFAITYVQVARAWKPTYTPQERTHELNTHSIGVEGLLATSPAARVPYAQALSRFGEGEWRGFPGVVTVALAALPLWWLRPKRATSGPYRALLVAIGAALVLLATAVVLALRDSGVLAAGLRPLAPVPMLTIALVAAGWWGVRRAGRVSPGEAPEQARLRVIALAYAAVIVLGALLSLGPVVYAWGVSLGTGIYREDWLPVLSILRTPGRFAMLVALGSAVLAGIGTRLLLARTPSRYRIGAVIVLLLLVNLDLRFAPIAVAEAPRVPRGVYRWLAQSDEPGSVIEYPLRRSLWWMYASPEHGRPLVNGSGYVQPLAFALLERQPDLSRAQLEIAWEHFHPRFAIVREGLYRDRPGEQAALAEAVATQPDALVERVRFGGDVVYEVTDRGRGADLYRRWPRASLERAGGLIFKARVHGGANGTTTILEVLLNGRRLLRAEGGQAEREIDRTAVYAREALIDGVNTFHIRGDYRRAPDAPPREIGTTGAVLPADVAVESRRDGSTIQVNGRRATVNKGYALAVLDADTGEVQSYDTFNTSWFREESERLARAIAALPDGTPVVVASEFDVSRMLTAEAVDALRTLGLREDLRGRMHALHAAVGVKGAPPGTAVEVVHPDTASLSLGDPQFRPVELNGLELR